MEELIQGARFANAGVYAALAAVSLMRFLRRRDGQTLWFAMAFAVLSGAVVAGLVADAGLGPMWVRKLTVGAVLLFPYFLHRFAASFGAAPSWAEAPAALLTAGVVVWFLLLPDVAASGAPRPPSVTAFVLAVAVQWTTLSSAAAVRLWRAGRRQTTVPRRRMQMLALGSSGLNLAILVAAVAPAGPGSTRALLLQMLALASAAFFALGFSPPTLLRAAWRRPEEEALRRAAVELMGARTEEEVARGLLPHAAAIVGGRGAALLDPSGRTIGAHGAAVPDASGGEGGEAVVRPDEIRLDLPAGRLLVAGSPQAPFFGQEELDLVRTLGTLANLALERCRLLELERGARQRMDEAQRMASIGSWEWDLASGQVTWSEELYRIFGLEPGEFDPSGEAAAQFVHADDREALVEVVEAARLNRRPYAHEHRVVRTDGEVRTVLSRGRFVVDESGEPVKAIGTSQDVTDRARAAQTISRLARIVESSSDAIVGWDPDGTIFSWNAAAERLYGHPAEEAVGRPFSMLLPPGWEDEPRRISEALARGEEVEHHETQHRTRDGRMVDVFVTVSPVRDAAGRLAGISTIARDVTDLKRARELQARLATIVDSSDDAILSKDRDGIITSWNAGAQRLYGYAPEEAVGRPVAVIVPPERAGEEARILETVLAGKSVRHYGTRRARKDGSVVDVSLTVSPIRGPDGEVLGASSIARDVSDERRVQEELARAKEEAEKANRAKSEFLSRMSHELRTPMNAILGFAQLLDMGRLAGDDSESVEQILKAGRHLLRLIDEVLDISRIETGRLALSIEPVEVARVARETLDLVAPLASERRITLQVDPGLAGHVLADHQRLKQVLLNLVANAVKYNREGGSVAITAAPSGDRTAIRVSDTGPGISPDKVELLFTPFERLGAEESGTEGTGLGLALSRRLVEAMGGSIGVESNPGAGSTFSVVLPTAEAPREAARPEPTHEPLGEPRAGASSRTVLYIEDNLSNLKLVERVFARRPEISLVGVMQGTLGVELARRHAPDLILLDLHLPDLPGDEVLRRLRAEPATSAIPVVVISADATQHQIQRLLAAGARTYLTKPLDVRELLQVVDDL